MPILRRIFPLFIDFTYYTCYFKKGELIMRFRELERIVQEKLRFPIIEVIFLCELLILF